VKVRLLSMDPIRYGKWDIKASITNLDTICMIFRHKNTGNVIIRYFTDELEANLFTERLVYDSESEEPNSDTL